MTDRREGFPPTPASSSTPLHDCSSVRLFHYSRHPFTGPVQSVPQRPAGAYSGPAGKPAGFWVSAEDGGSEQWGWAEWCRAEEWGLSSLANAAEIILGPDAPILRISTAGQLEAFDEAYRHTRDRFDMRAIDWNAVAREYGGIIIAPYRFDCRYDFAWYYGWDCSSGCIWNGDLIEAVIPLDAGTEAPSYQRSSKGTRAGGHQTPTQNEGE